jgi:hypothetical protein
MTTKLSVTCALALTLCLANSPIMGKGSEAAPTMKPLMATSFASGSKHILAFFVSENGTCHLTLMVSELENDHPQALGARMLIPIPPLKSSRLDVADGKSLEFQCGQAAASMTVSNVDRISYLRDSSSDR